MKISCQLIGIAFASLSLIGIAVASEQDAATTDCDRYTASDFAQTKPGVSFDKIDAHVAIPACQRAVQVHPTSVRLIFELGRAYLKDRKFADALSQLRQAANSGYSPAMNLVGTMYEDGSGVTRDYHEAINWYQKAAERGDPAGELNLGSMYENGHGVPQSYIAALQWYRKAAAHGSAQAQESIGYFYSQGWGVKRDDVEAIAWFRKAAAQGMAEAKHNLEVMYERNSAPPKKQLAKSDEIASDPSQTTVIVHGLGMIPYPFVCADLASWQLFYDLYSSRVEDRMEDTFTRGQSVLLRGPSLPVPNPSDYGCTAIKPGSKAILVSGSKFPPVIRVNVGKEIITGVINPNMLQFPEN